MGLIKDDLCCKYREERGTYMHALWECPRVFALDYIGKWLRCKLPISSRLCVVGDRTIVQFINKS